jgi:type I restriction enzyme M protein
MTLTEILRDSNYKLTQFSEEKIRDFEENIIIKESKGKANNF